MDVPIEAIVAALVQWGLVPSRPPVLLNHSENHTFRIDTETARYCLRVHRPGYQSQHTILSELAWLEALGQATDLVVPRPLPTIGGTPIGLVASGESERAAVLFAFIEGAEPRIEDDLAALFANLGAKAARLHAHARAWTRPPGFERQVWSAGAMLDPDGLWGDWRQGPDLDAAGRAVLDAVDARLRSDLAEYGDGPDRFGLVHADMRLGNLLVTPERVALIDFDDMGFCWFLYDFGASVSFHETEDAIPALKSAWIEGYETVAPLDGEGRRMLDVFVMLRRMLLLAWIASHAETPLAARHRSGFAGGTVALGRRYLDDGRLWVA